MPDSTLNITGNVGLPVVSVDPAGGSTFVALAELIEPAFPEGSSDSYELTHTDLTDGHKTFAVGWADGGEISLTLNYREDTWVALQALIGVDDVAFEITWTDPLHTTTDSSLTFVGHVTGHGTPQPAMEDRWTITVTIKVDGKPAFAVGTEA